MTNKPRENGIVHAHCTFHPTLKVRLEYTTELFNTSNGPFDEAVALAVMWRGSENHSGGITLCGYLVSQVHQTRFSICLELQRSMMTQPLERSYHMRNDLRIVPHSARSCNRKSTARPLIHAHLSVGCPSSSLK